MEPFNYGCLKVRLEVLLKMLMWHPCFWDIPGMFKAWDIHQTFSENNQRTSHKGKEQYHGVIPCISNLDIHQTFHLSSGVACWCWCDLLKGCSPCMMHQVPITSGCNCLLTMDFEGDFLKWQATLPDAILAGKTRIRQQVYSNLAQNWIIPVWHD